VWWFSENLKYGKTINCNEFPSDNGIVEKYVREQNDPDQDGYYLPEEAHLYSLSEDSGICPPGWSLADSESCGSLWRDYLMDNQDDFFRSGGITGINLDNAGYYNVDSSRFVYSLYSYWWGNKIIPADSSRVTYSLICMGDAIRFQRRSYDLEGTSYFPERDLFQQIRFALPVRCIKKDK